VPLPIEPLHANFRDASGGGTVNYVREHRLTLSARRTVARQTSMLQRYVSTQQGPEDAKQRRGPRQSSKKKMDSSSSHKRSWYYGYNNLSNAKGDPTNKVRWGMGGCEMGSSIASTLATYRHRQGSREIDGLDQGPGSLEGRVRRGWAVGNKIVSEVKCSAVLGWLRG
jgi:hypothetical protein